MKQAGLGLGRGWGKYSDYRSRGQACVVVF